MAIAWRGIQVFEATVLPVSAFGVYADCRAIFHSANRPTELSQWVARLEGRMKTMQVKLRSDLAALAKDIADRHAKAGKWNARAADRMEGWEWRKAGSAVPAVALMASILFCATPSGSIAQTPETCVAYMDAFASLKAERESIHSKHQGRITTAYKRAQEAERAARKSARACKSKDVEGWKRCNDRFSAIPDAEDDPNYRLAHEKRSLDLARAEQTFTREILEIYRGPTSKNESVLRALVKQDIERYHYNGFPMPQ